MAIPKPSIVIGSCRFVRAVDADTYEIEVRRKVRVRALDCWAPETHETSIPGEKQSGIEALNQLNQLVSYGDECTLEITPDGDGDIGDGLTFGRVVGKVYIHQGWMNGKSLGEITTERGLTFRTKAELQDYLETMQHVSGE